MTKTLWSGRFQEEIDAVALAYTETIAVDSEMLMEDLWGSQAHAIMLAACGIISTETLQDILEGLDEIRHRSAQGEFALDVQDEDVHMNVERYLIERDADHGARLHTARSRNDQVITDTRMHTRELILRIEDEVVAFQRILLGFAAEHARTITVGYTHTQHAQPVTLGFWATAYFSMLMRDLTRLRHAYQTTNINPLGACALSGTTFPTDRRMTTALLGFDDIQEHSLDAVSSRDFAVELLGALAILVSNLSRIAEEIVYWSTYEFRTVQVADAFAMGSSIMPQKKNPCVAELIRGRTGRIYGLLVQSLTSLKGIPSGYNRDLQEDKPPLWDAADGVVSTLRALRGMITTLEVDQRRMRDLTHKNFSLATELADYLVRVQDRPFRECHHIVGQVVARLIQDGKTFEDIPATVEALRAFGVETPAEELRAVLAPERAVERHRSIGGTAPTEVERMIKDGHRRLDSYERDLSERRNAVARASTRTAAVVSDVLHGRPVADALADIHQGAAT